MSFVIVYLWSGAFQPGQRTDMFGDQANQSQQPLIQGEKGSSLSENQSESIPPPSEKKQKMESSQEEKITILENEKLSVKLSDRGGVVRQVYLKEYQSTIPIKNLLSINAYEKDVFQVESISDDQITYVLRAGDITIYRQYFLSPGEYIVKANTRIENNGKMSKQQKMDINAYTIDMSSLDIEGAKKDNDAIRSRSLLEYVVFADRKMHRKNNAFKFKDKELKQESAIVDWVGFRTRYYCSIIKPEYATIGYKINPVNEKVLEISMKSSETDIPAGGYVDFSHTIFSGPEKKTLLKTYDSDFEQIKRYYRNGLLDGMAKLMNAVLHLLHKVVPIWGICILLMSVIVYFSMYPLTMRGMLSMKKMQSLQPEILKIKDKYKNDQQKANMEVMELYKKHKINPLGGCLPMLLQMPVFIGLYQVLWRSVYFNGTSFLWIKDLSQPDHLFKLPFTIPLVNSEYFNILPVLMMIIMFFQQKMSAKNMVMTDPAQKSQQKMMSTIMPLFLGFIFYTFASGLTLYFTMFYLFSSFTQWKMSKQGKGR